MGVLANAAKKAKSFGAKGFVYGAVAGAAIAVIALVGLAALVSATDVLGPFMAEATSGGVMQMLTTSVGAVKAGLSSLELVHFAQAAGIGAGLGAGTGAVAGAASGAIYGAFVDEKNPMPKFVAKIARGIAERTPILAGAVAKEVNQKEAVQVTAAALPVRDAVTTAPVLALPEEPSFSSTAFRDKLTTQREPETASAQR